jgi:hypothetical protein
MLNLEFVTAATSTCATTATTTAILQGRNHMSATKDKTESARCFLLLPFTPWLYVSVYGHLTAAVFHLNPPA